MYMLNGDITLISFIKIYNYSKCYAINHNALKIFVNCFKIFITTVNAVQLITMLYN